MSKRLTRIDRDNYGTEYRGHYVMVRRCNTRWQAICTGLVGNRGILMTGYCLTPDRALEIAQEKIDSGQYRIPDYAKAS